MKTFKFCPLCGTSLVMDARLSPRYPSCPSCAFVAYRNPLPAVVVLIHDDRGRVLLGKRCSASYCPGRWSLPGGYLEVGEDYQAAAIREGLEETGLVIIPEGISSVISNRFESGAETLAIVFLATASPGAEFKAGDDLVDLRWIAAGDEMPDLAFEADTASIQRYWFGDDAVVRPYSGFFSAV
jgi:ADP-ribose pyrophosphatase YjhB (NUDIX family)